MSLAVAADEWAKRRQRDNRARGQAVQRAVLGEDAGRPSECGLSNGSDIEVGSDGVVAWSYRGWQTCGWSDCAYCGPLVRLYRLAEVTVATVEAEKLGRIPLLLTLAPPHTRGTRIRAGLDRIDAVWKAIATTDDKSMRARWRRRWAVEEYFTARECTLGGVHGAHPHHHVLLFVDPLTSPGVAELLEEMEAAGYDDERIVRELPVHLAQAVEDDFLASMAAWPDQRPRNGVAVDDPAFVAERRRRRQVVEGWTGAGVQCTPAGVGAARIWPSWRQG